MKKKLELEHVCEILLRQELIASAQQDMVLSGRLEQTEKLRKLFSLKDEYSNGSPSFIIIPSDIIASFKLKKKDNGKSLTEECIMQAVATAFDLPFRKIDPLELDPDVVTRTISKAFAIKNLVVPIAIEDGVLKIAMVDPLNTVVLEDISKVQKLQVSPVISTKSDILKLIMEFYGFNQSVAKAEKELVAPFVNVGNLEQYSKLGTISEIESTDQYIKNAVEYLFRYALEQRASDIHIEPKRDRSIVRLRIDGVLHTTYSMPVVVHNAVVSRIKSQSRLDIAEKRRPQDGRIKLSDKGRDVEIRVSTIPVAFGEKVVLRVLNPDVLFQDLENLGFLSADLIHFRNFLKQPNGIILVTGPTGSGKTTTLYSSLKFLSTSAKNVTTVEDPIEMVCEDYNQIAVQPAVGITFASILKNILRQDPDIIMIGEIRDHETAKNAIQAALTGHLVLSTLHTNDAASAVTRLVDLGVEPFLISSTLLGVLAQRLVRIVCPHCQESFSVSRGDLEGLGFVLPVEVKEDSIELKKGKGCRKCRNTGYLGREGVFEVLNITEQIKQLINRKASSEEIKKQANSEGMKPLKENVVMKVLKGRTTFNEAQRCISQED